MLQAMSRYAVVASRSGSALIARSSNSGVNTAMSSNSPTRYDLVIYGATGFTGQYVVEEVARVAEAEKQNNGQALTWAVAGRNKSKLLKAVEEAERETGLPLTNVGVLEADVADLSSVEAMTKQARVVINCVGPYIKYGESVVKACIDNGASHVDISGEPQFLEGMQLKYDKEAQEKGVHIVGACGYDSIPAEMGLVHLERQFPGGLCSAEMYTSTRNKTGKPTPLHTGTLESALNAIANSSATAAQKRKLFPTKMPKPKFPLPKRSVIHHCPELGCYGVPLPSDVPVVHRTQRYRHDVQLRQPVEFTQYISARKWFHAVGIIIGLLYFALMSLFSWTRNFVMKYPEMMTGGVFSHAGATREALKGFTMKTVFLGRGWTQPLSSPSDQHSSPPDDKKILTIEGPDPGYGATSLMMVASAMTILREKEKLSRCGVVTPAVAFENTAIIDRLLERGMTFTVKE